VHRFLVIAFVTKRQPYLRWGVIKLDIGPKFARRDFEGQPSAKRGFQIRGCNPGSPPAVNSAHLQQAVLKFKNTSRQSTILDIQRYLRWADKAIKSRLPKKQSRRGHAPPKAA
jgi:hypothetical protein